MKKLGLMLLMITALSYAQDFYYNGSRVGKIEDDGDIYKNGSRVGEVEDDGDVYRNGSRIGTAKGVNLKWAGGIIFFFFTEYF